MSLRASDATAVDETEDHELSFIEWHLMRGGIFNSSLELDVSLPKLEEKIGLVGLGNIGSILASRLGRHCEDMIAWSRRIDRDEADLPAGVARAASLEHIATSREVIITCVTDGAALKEIVEKMAPFLRPGQLLIDMSTVHPEDARSVGETLRKLGVHFMDAPFSGGLQGAASGKISIMVGSDHAALEKGLPVLSRLGSVIHCGPLGCGQELKAINQMVGYNNLMTTAELLVLAHDARMDLRHALCALSTGLGASWASEVKGEMMVEGDCSHTQSVKNTLKDLRIVKSLATSANQTLTITNKVIDVLEAMDSIPGLDKLGNQALFEFLLLLPDSERVPAGEKFKKLPRQMQGEILEHSAAYLHLLILFEALRFGQIQGLEPKLILQVLSGGIARSAVLERFRHDARTQSSMLDQIRDLNNPLSMLHPIAQRLGINLSLAKMALIQ